MPISRDFVSAGNAIFTIQLDGKYAREHKLADHYTFQVQFVPANGQWKAAYFVKLLTGPDNNNDYTYLGILNPSNGFVQVTSKSVFLQNHMIVRILNRTLRLIWENNTELMFSKGFGVYHENRCGRCGRRLTTPESILTGIGPECSKKL